MGQPVERPTVSNLSSITWGRIVAWGGLLLLLIIVGVALLGTRQGQPRPGQRAPAFILTTFEGQQISLEELKGKVVVLNFWASWCVTCKDEAAFLEEAWQEYRTREDVVFLGVAWTDTDSKAKEYLSHYSISYPNGPDLGTRISQTYRITGVPETYIIDQNGILVDVHLMPFASAREITSIINQLLTP